MGSGRSKARHATHGVGGSPAPSLHSHASKGVSAGVVWVCPTLALAYGWKATARTPRAPGGGNAPRSEAHTPKRSTARRIGPGLDVAVPAHTMRMPADLRNTITSTITCMCRHHSRMTSQTVVAARQRRLGQLPCLRHKLARAHRCWHLPCRRHQLLRNGAMMSMGGTLDC